MPLTEIFPVTQKLALYFLGQGDGATRVLEADYQPEYTDTDGTVRCGWTIGRIAISAICFRNGAVSKTHAVLSAKIDKQATLESDEVVWVWQVTDRVSTNGTFLESPGSPPYRIAPGVPYEIHEGSVAQFGVSASRIKFSFDIDDTHSDHEKDTDPSTGIKSTTEAQPESASAQTSPWFVPTILEPVWGWFTAQHPVFQALIISIASGLAALWIHKN